MANYVIYPGQALRATAYFTYGGPAVSLALNAHVMLGAIEKWYKQYTVNVPASPGVGVAQQAAFTHDEIIAAGVNERTIQLRARVYVYLGGWVLLAEVWSPFLVAYAV